MIDDSAVRIKNQTMALKNSGDINALDSFHFVFLKRLVSKGAAVIYLSPETSVTEISKKRNLDIIRLDYWLEQV